MIIERGWCQGAYKRNGCFCLSGALLEVDVKCFDLEYDAVRKALRVDGYLSTWNDAPGRTKDDVLNLLDNGIRRLHESET